MDSIVQEAINKANAGGSESTSRQGPQGRGSDSDEELRRIVEGIKTSIKVVGCGGAGCNTIDRLLDMGVEGGEVITVNTDALHLLYSKAPSKILIGTSVTGGVGAGNDPEIGEQCAEADVDKISSALQGADLVFVTCGLGGGTGTGSAPVVAEIAKELQALTIAIVTLPFSVEGHVRAENALKGLKKLRKYADTVIVIPNDRLLDIAPNLPLNAAFKVADELLSNSVKGITEMVTKPGLVNLDFADVRAIMKDGGTAMIGLGASSKDTSMEARSRESVEKALTSPLLDTDISNAVGALINIIGSRDMTLEESEEIVRIVSERISPDAEIIWGAQIEEGLERNVIKTLLILSGVSVPGYEEELEDKVERHEGKGGADIGLKSL
ncbi:MAG: cell division protein FtsZ [Candidatus Altiarchaeales archaeon]|nr:cell division protein FtsZ [Candidatus Altiarchaeales archaeon]MBD3416695.1 cell division protein FtsZ [Candidatus Altiarchaeales archaeon]